MYYGYMCRLSVCCMIYSLRHVAHYLCTIIIAGKFGRNNVWQMWMSDFDKKLANEYCRWGKICWAKYL